VQISSLSPLQAIRTPNYWIFSLVQILGIAGWNTLVGNITQMLEALGGKEGDQDVYVSIMSIANCLGRMFVGFFSDRYARTIPRPFFLVLSIALFSCSNFLLAFADRSALYAGCLLSGFAYGSYAALNPALIAEFFGIKHFGKMYAAFVPASIVHSYLISVRLTSYIYESNITDGGRTCYGTACYRYTYLILAAFGVGAVVAAVWLAKRTAHYYKDVIDNTIIEKVTAKLGVAPDSPNLSPESKMKQMHGPVLGRADDDDGVNFESSDSSLGIPDMVEGERFSLADPKHEAIPADSAPAVGSSFGRGNGGRGVHMTIALGGERRPKPARKSKPATFAADQLPPD